MVGRGLEVWVSSPHWLFKFLLASLKGRLLPCLGVKHSLHPCPVPPYPQQHIFPIFLWSLGLGTRKFPIPIPIIMFCTILSIIAFILVWFIITDIKYAICCMIASHGVQNCLPLVVCPVQQQPIWLRSLKHHLLGFQFWPI